MIAQSCHAVVEFCLEHNDIAKRWHDISNYIVILEVENEFKLHQIVREAENLNIKHSIFKEPDIADEATAVILEPCEASKRLCSQLKLALCEKKIK